MHTIDPKMLIAWGNVLAFGASKYHQRNFLVAPGMAWGRVYDSLQGHLQAFWAGEWLDEESGLPHLAHVLCNLQFLWTYHEHEAYRFGDDRPSSIEYQGKTYEEWEAAFKMASKLREPFNPDAAPEAQIPVPQIKTGRGPIGDILAGLAKSPGRQNSDRGTNKGQWMSKTGSVVRLAAIVEAAARNENENVSVCLADLENILDLAQESK